MPFWFPLKLSVSFDTPLHLTFDPPPEPSQAGAWVSITTDGITAKGRAPMAYTLPNDKEVNLGIKYVDKKGNPAKVDGAVKWSSSDETICGVSTLAEDGTQAVAIPAEKVGQCQIVAKADADMGEGVSEIITPFDVEVVAGSAVAGVITPQGEPQPIPESNRKVPRK